MSKDIHFYQKRKSTQVVSSMIISDLSHLEPISEFTDILGSAGAAVGTTAVATGTTTSTKSIGYTTANPLPGGGSYALGLGYAQAVGTGNNPTATTTASGAGQGDIVLVIPGTVNYNLGSSAVSKSGVLVLALDLP